MIRALRSGPMQLVGTILELWRYPISSLGGERMLQVDVQTHGVVGDRAFALFDPTTGLAAAPEKEPRWRPALFLTCLSSGCGLPHVSFPDGSSYRLDDKELPAQLDQHFGFPVGVGIYATSSSMQKFDFPVIENRYTPSPLHVLTTSTLNKLEELVASAVMDPKRFRPSLMIETENNDTFLENNWIGATLHLGQVRVKVVEGTKRCGMTLIAQPGINEEPEVLRNILRHNKRNLGVYCQIEQTGVIREGDNVYLTA